MTAPAAEDGCRLTSRISSLSSADQTLVERLVETLEARASAPAETAMDRIRRRIEAVLARTD